jgi:hypothetical protein
MTAGVSPTPSPPSSPGFNNTNPGLLPLWRPCLPSVRSYWRYSSFCRLWRWRSSGGTYRLLTYPSALPFFRRFSFSAFERGERLTSSRSTNRYPEWRVPVLSASVLVNCGAMFGAAYATAVSLSFLHPSPSSSSLLPVSPTFLSLSVRMAALSYPLYPLLAC